MASLYSLSVEFDQLLSDEAVDRLSGVVELEAGPSTRFDEVHVSGLELLLYGLTYGEVERYLSDVIPAALPADTSFRATAALMSPYGDPDDLPVVTYHGPGANRLEQVDLIEEAMQILVRLMKLQGSDPLIADLCHGYIVGNLSNVEAMIFGPSGRPSSTPATPTTPTTHDHATPDWRNVYAEYDDSVETRRIVNATIDHVQRTGTRGEAAILSCIAEKLRADVYVKRTGLQIMHSEHRVALIELPFSEGLPGRVLASFSVE